MYLKGLYDHVSQLFRKCNSSFFYVNMNCKASIHRFSNCLFVFYFAFAKASDRVIFNYPTLIIVRILT